jgi:hypothetical protein
MMLKATKDGFSMEEALSDIASSTDKASTSLKYFDTRAVATSLVLAENIDKVQGLNNTLLDSEGAAKAMAEIMDNTLEGSMMKLKSATEGLGISFGEIMAPAVRAAAGFISDIAMKFSNLSEGTKKTIVVIASLVAGIGPLIFAVGALTVAFAYLAANPIILIITGIILAIAGLVAVFIYVKNNAQAFADFFYNLWVKIANGFIDSVKFIIQGHLQLADMLGLDIGSGVNAWLDSFKLTARESKEEFQTLGEAFEDVKKTIGGALPTPEPVKIPKAPTTDTDTGEGEKDLTEEQQKKRIGKLKQELFEVNTIVKKIGETPILPVVNVDAIKTSLEKLADDSVHIFAQMGREMGAALTTGLKDLATEGLVSFGQFLGDVISGGDMTVEDFGRGLLDSIGKFMGQFGEAMIAMGIAQTLLDVAIKSGNGPLAIIGGVALVAAGAAISNLSKKGIDSGSSATSPSYSGSGSAFNNKDNGYSFENNITLSGRDMIITQKRERAFGR